MNYLFYFTVIFCSLNLGEQKKNNVQHVKNEYINRRYILYNHGCSYDYRFKSNGKFKFIYTHFELGVRKLYGKYEIKHDTLKIKESPSGELEQYLLSDSCLTDFEMKCIYKRVR